MKYYTIQLFLFLLYITTTSITIAMKQSEINLGVPVSVKNSSVGLLNNTYDVYIQVIPSLNASKNIVNRERLIPYDDIKEIGYLCKIKDIKTRGSSVVSSWTSNQGILDKAKEDAVNGKDTSEGSLLFIISAGTTGFYLSYYIWRPSELSRLGLSRNSSSGEYALDTSQMDDETNQSNEPHPSDDFQLIG